MLGQTLRLSIALAKAEFKLKNEGSYLGIFWYLLNPLFMFFLLLTIFLTRLGQNIPSYPLYLLLGIVVFNFFQQTTIESTRIINENRWLIKSIKFPYESLIGSIIFKNLFSHFFEIIIFVIFLLLFKTPITGIIFYPLILVFFCLFSAGFAFILSALTVYFIDLENIWLFASRLIWLATPIFYAAEGQPKLLLLNLLNPMYYFITIARKIIIYSSMPELWMLLGMLGYTFLVLIIGLFIFSKLRAKFAEMI